MTVPASGATPTPEPTPDPEPASPAGGETPDWQAEAEKWKGFARQHEKRAKENAEAAKRLADLEEAGKTEAQKLTDRATAAEQKAAAATATATRLEVALEKAPEGMPIATIRKLAKRLAGTTREELEADADELFAEFGTGATPPPGKTPTPALSGGGKPNAEPDIDPEKIAESIYSRGRI